MIGTKPQLPSIRQRKGSKVGTSVASTARQKSLSDTPDESKDGHDGLDEVATSSSGVNKSCTVDTCFPVAANEEEHPKDPPLQKLIGYIVGFIRRHRRLCSVALFSLGCIWFCLFPLVCITSGELETRSIFVAENALSSGARSIRFDDGNMKTADLVKKRLQMNGNSLQKKQRLVELMKNHGFSSSQIHSSGTVYGTLRPKSGSDRRESIVLVTKLDFDNASSSKIYSGTGVSICLTLISMLANEHGLGKNFILVVSENASELSHWLHDYHSSDDSTTNMERAGSIIGGLVLDFAEQDTSSNVATLDVLLPGINGQLPDLDLATLAIIMSRGMTVSLNRVNPKSTLRILHKQARSMWSRYGKTHVNRAVSDGVFAWIDRIEGLLRFMCCMAIGQTDWHAVMLPYNIHALTIAVGPRNDSQYNRKNSVVMNRDFVNKLIARATEGALRSIGFLEERLHQAYFLYLMPNSQSFVSIGEFFGPLLCLNAPLIFQLLGGNDGHEPRSAVQDINFVKLGVDPLHSTIIGGAICALATSFGVVVMTVSQISVEFALPVTVALSAGMCLIFRILANDEVRAIHLRTSIKAIVLFELAIAHICIGTVNFPFAFIASWIMAPFYAVLYRPKNSFLWFLLLVWWTAIWAPAAFYSVFAKENGLIPTGDVDLSSPSIVSRITESFQLAASLYQEFHVFHLGYFCLVFFPVQSLALAILL